MSTRTIVAEDVVRTYGRTRALDGVDLVAQTGVTGLLGPNGAGKTTLLRVLATADHAESGRVCLLGRDPDRAGQLVEIRRRLGFLPQEPGFYRGFSAFEFVDYVAILKEMNDRRARHDEVRRVLTLVGLAEERGRRIRALSGGMRRRLALAGALVGQPELLILDEPTAGLDPEQRLRFRELISAIAEECIVVLATHMTDDIAALCRDVVVLDGGRVAFSGSVAELVDTATGRVWQTPDRDQSATVSWRTGAGPYRNIGAPPAECVSLEPTVEDAYLLLVGSRVWSEGAAA